MRFSDRSHAGSVLAGLLDHLADQPTVVLGLPRGGVPVGYEIARRLAAPLEVLLVRKLGVPTQPELAMGAIGEGGVRVLDEQRIERLRIRSAAVERVERRERRELARQAGRFRGNAPPADLQNKTAVIVDDGIATGATAQAACLITRHLGAGRVVLATPVAPRDAAATFAEVADELVVAHTPRRFAAIGMFYRDFRPTPDHSVVELLDLARQWTPGHEPGR
ncbi:MAG: phosphoribosyltransferase [Acidimicrobiia bacterium]|nr:phosphoribosyltransferase [Acidimicrobiia bacterium]